MSDIKIVDATENNIHEFGMCGYKKLGNPGYVKKLEWTKKQMKNGMKYKFLVSEEKGAIGAVEYIPGEHTWRAIEAKEYMVIHCIYIMSKNFKGKGYGKLLVEECINDAKSAKLNGVAVVTRKGSWMVSKDIFASMGFELADKSKPDFELYVKKFDAKYENPKFAGNMDKVVEKYNEGLYMFVSHQCPYVNKAIVEIGEACEKEIKVKLNIVELNEPEDAQNSPCAFGSFCMIYNGKVIADHPISKTRFMNIMNKMK